MLSARMARSLLIVDDEPQLLRLLGRVFEREGYEVEQAADGDAAIAIVDERAADLDVAIVDVFIPPRGAGQVLDALAAKCPGVAIVVVSGDWLEQQLAARLEAAGGRYLRKPFHPDALVEAVRSLAG